MPLQLELKKKLCTRTERVKSVEIHPTEPWILSALFSGHVTIHHYETQSHIRTIEVSYLAVRCARFVPREQWIVTCGDDMFVRVFNANTGKNLKEFEAHGDYIRFMAVHPTLPYLLTASDDMTIRLWNWERDWVRVASCEGHTHYVMAVDWNPKDPKIFASASLDRSVKVWGVPAPASSNAPAAEPQMISAHYSLLGHEKGVNSVSYSPNGEKPFLVSGSDDHTVRVWDYQTKQCLQVLTGHTANVSAVLFHATLPYIVSGSEDGTMKLWHSSTYKLEATLNYAMERCWSLAQGDHAVALGFDQGSLLLKMGSEQPVASLHGGKAVYAQGMELLTVNLRQLDESAFVDGENLMVAPKDLGVAEVFPQTVCHHPNGRFISVCGGGEYVIYTSQALRNKAYGSAMDIVFSPEGHYAVRETGGKVLVFHNFAEKFSFRPDFPVDRIYGGRLLAVQSSDCFVCFYDWQEYHFIQRVDVAPQRLLWSPDGVQVALVTEGATYILAFNPKVLTTKAARDNEDEEDAFTEIGEISETISSAHWVVAGCLVVTTRGMRMQLWLGGLVETVAFLDRVMWIIGYLDEADRIVLLDKNLHIVTFSLSRHLIAYQLAIVARNFAEADAIFKKVPPEKHDSLARFLDALGHKEAALQVSKDPDHRFSLALALGKLDVAASIVRDATVADGEAVAQQRWKSLGDAALQAANLELAAACFREANDHASCLILFTSTGDRSGLAWTAESAEAASVYNVARSAYHLLHRCNDVVRILLAANQASEAAFYARTYCPQELPKIIPLWTCELSKISSRLADSLVFEDFVLSSAEYSNPSQAHASTVTLSPIKGSPALSVAGVNRQHCALDRDSVSETPRLPTNDEGSPSHVHIPAGSTNEFEDVDTYAAVEVAVGSKAVDLLD